MLRTLLHSSKTMRAPIEHAVPFGVPRLLDAASQLAAQYRELSPEVLADMMKISFKKAQEVHELYSQWSVDPKKQVPAIDAFVGDIYSGLQVQSWSDADRVHAHDRLMILSGLYGILRACDGILPYRLEMAYKLPNGGSLYEFWSDRIAAALSPDTTHLVNLSAVEYTKALLPYLDQPVTTPKFLTRSSKTGEPTFVTVHAKIARGAFARWMIQQRVDDADNLQGFTDLGYVYDPKLSTATEPAFVCDAFQGLGLSVRLT